MPAPLRGSTLRIAKLSILLLWAWALVSLVVDPAVGGWVVVGRYAGGGLVLAHGLELLVYLPKLARAGESPSAHLIPLLVYGGVHFFSLDLGPRGGAPPH